MPVWSRERHCPRRLPASRILRNLIMINMLRKNICLLLPQPNPSPPQYPTPTRWFIYHLNAVLYLTVKCTKPLVFFMPANTLTDMLVYIPGHRKSKDCEKAYQYLLSQACRDIFFFSPQRKKKPPLISEERDGLAAAGTV